MRYCLREVQNVSAICMYVINIVGQQVMLSAVVRMRFQRVTPHVSDVQPIDCIWPSKVVSGPHSLQINLIFTSPVVWRTTYFSDLVNFACIVKFGKQYLSCNWIMHIAWANMFLKHCSRGMRKICSGKFHHPPCCFSFRHVLIIISPSIF
jgi:hypothetical protein